MSKLQKLSLYLSVNRTNRFIDGNDLKQNIINSMPLLNRFHFDFRSTIFLKDQIDLLSNEDIMNSFKDFLNNEIISCVNYFPEAIQDSCHIYSCPFISRSYENIANNFSDGIFTCISEISLFNKHSFEHEFFARIAESFSFMKCLTITNRKTQNDKKLKNNTQHLSLITYPNLKYVDFKDSHDDYIEQFLLDIKTCLSYGIDIYVNYKTLKRVTHNFRRNATQINCSKVIYQCFDRIAQFPKYFKNYFHDIETNL